MFRILRTFGLPALVGLAVSAACSSDPPSGSNNGGSAGEGGTPSGNGGKNGGSSSNAGSAGKAGGKGGTAGNGGKGGSAGSAAVVGGAGAGPGPDPDTGGQGGAGGAAACSHCASGECDADLNCINCVADSECTAPLLCNDGSCTAACTAQAEGTSTGCDGGLTCCSLHCAELANDSKNCGSCGHACDTGQFCGAVDCGQGGAGGAGAEACVACHDTTLANICSISKIIVILDTNANKSDGNRVPGRKVGEALHAQCSPTPVLTEAEQDSPGALNITTGRPVAGGGELLVVAGGPYYQQLEGYLEEQKIAPIFWKYDDVAGVTEFRKTSDGSLVVGRATEDANDHTTEDDFIIQFSRDPASGSLVLNVQGFWLSGTVAAAFQITTGFLPQLETRDKGWYAYTWKDKDADKAPDADEIELIASGN